MLAEADGSQRLARAGGGNVEHQLGCRVSFERREDLLLMLVQFDIPALEHELVFLYELVGFLDEFGRVKIGLH